MLKYRPAILFAVVVGVASFGAMAQDTPPPSDDPMIRSINEQLDRGAGELDRPESAFADRGSRTSGALGQMLQGVAALCVVLALVLAIYYGLRRWGKGVPMLAGPHLGKVLGRIYLDKGTALHFVRVADRVLVVGVNGNTIANVGDYDASVFESSNGSAAGPPQPEPFNPDSFLAELQERSREMKVASLPQADEDEIAALRGDIQRLQRFLREENREPEA